MTEPVVNWLPYQRAWMQDDARFKIGMMTRRGGKTFATGGEAVDSCINAEIEKRRVRWTILSRSERTAKEALDDAVKPLTQAFWSVYRDVRRAGTPEFGEDEFRGEDATYKTFEARFPSGSSIIALSASSDAARGFGGNLILDEFAFHQDSRGIWRAAFPVVMRDKHKLRVISTPNGKSNKFYDVWTDTSGIWSKHEVDIYEAVRLGLDVDPEELRKALNDEDAWRQEFQLEFLDSATSWLDFDLITSCEEPGAGEPDGYRGGPVFVGVDIAVRNDLYVQVVLEQVGDRLVMRELTARQRITFAEQAALRASVFDRYRVLRMAIDQTGMGEAPVEEAISRYGETRVEGVLFTGPRKLELATAMKEAFQDRRVAIRAGDPVLRADLHAIRSVVGPTGARRLMADGDTDGHADRFWALALAIGAAASDYQPAAYRAVSGRAAAEAFEDRDIRLTAGFGTREGLW